MQYMLYITGTDLHPAVVTGDLIIQCANYIHCGHESNYAKYTVLPKAIFSSSLCRIV